MVVLGRFVLVIKCVEVEAPYAGMILIRFGGFNLSDS